jgi:hypothetical protein
MRPEFILSTSKTITTKEPMTDSLLPKDTIHVNITLKNSQTSNHVSVLLPLRHWAPVMLNSIVFSKHTNEFHIFMLSAFVFST